MTEREELEELSARAELADLEARAAGGRKAEEPGMLATIPMGVGKGFGSTVLGAQKLVGKGLNAISAKGSQGEAAAHRRPERAHVPGAAAGWEQYDDQQHCRAADA